MTRTRATSATHPDHTKLTELDRVHIAWLLWMMQTSPRLARRWSVTSIGEAYGVSRKTVTNCGKRYPR